MSKLTSKERNSLPDKDFVFRSQRKYPVQDEAHARAALSRVSQFGTADMKEKVSQAVRRKYPNMGKD